MDMLNFYIAVKIFGWGFGAGTLAVFAALFLYLWVNDSKGTKP